MINGRLEEYKDVILGSELFEGIDQTEIKEALAYLNARVERYEKGSLIVCRGFDVDAGIMLEGKAQISCYDEDFQPMIIAQIGEGSVFGGAAACVPNYQSPMDVIAMKDSVVLRLDLTPFVEGKSTDISHLHMIIGSNLVRSIASHAVYILLRMRVIAQHKLSNRLKLYLRNQQTDEDGWIRVPFAMKELASFLNTDRSNLYKEINNLKERGVLEWEGRRVRFIN